jgi:hypothetical protein
MANELARLFVTIGANTKEFSDAFKGLSGSVNKDMVAIKTDLSGLTKEQIKEQKEFDQFLKEREEEEKRQHEARMNRIRAIGAAFTAMGATIIGVLGLCTKAAKEEQVGIERLQVAIENVGLTYGGATGELEKWIDKEVQATAFADDQQREALSTLIPLTKDVTKAQELLGIAMDVARWKKMDLVTASELISKVYAGNLGMLTRYGIIVDENATSTEALAQVQKMAAGQAEAYTQTLAGQMELLKNNIDDVKEGIGGALIPILTDLFKKIQPVLQSIKEWITQNPELVKVIVIVMAAIGGLLTALGPLLMFLPGIVTALPLMGGALAALTGPVGIAIAALAALIAIGILVWKNWDTISAKAKEIWGGIVSFFKGVWNELVSGFENYVNIYINGINSIIGLINKIPGVNLKTIPTLNLGSIKAYASGGIVPGAIGEPQLALVHGGETINPPGASGITNNFSISQLVVREEADIQRIARELYRMQQVRYV